MTNGERNMFTATRVYDHNWNLVGSVDAPLDDKATLSISVDHPLAEFFVSHDIDAPVYAISCNKGRRWIGGLSEYQVLRTLDTKAKVVRATFTDEPPRDRITPPPGVD